jgi:raffinose/stachyose/melibiose transport system substrate-binding protein
VTNRFYRRLFVNLVFLSAFSGAVYAAPSSEANWRSSTPQENKTVLEYWTIIAFNEIMDYYRAFTDKYPNVDLQVTVYQDEEYKTQSRLALASRTGPDVWMTNTGSSFTQFVEGGGAMDITEIAESRQWDLRFDSGAYEQGKRNGKIYGLIVGPYFPWQAMYANADFFRDSGIPYPETVAELIEVSAAIRASGMQPVSWGNKDGWMGQIIFGDYMMQLVDPSIVDELNSGTLKWTESDAAVTALEAMVRMAEGGAFIDGYDSQDHTAAMSAWYGEKAAFLYMGAWFYGNMGAIDPPFEIETIALPKLEHDTTLKGVQLFADPMLFVNPESDVPELAIEFLDYHTAPEYYEVSGNYFGALTANREANEKVNLPPYLKADVLMKQFALPQSNYWTVTFPTPVEEALAKQIQLVLAGQATAQEALAAVEAEHARNR